MKVPVVLSSLVAVASAVTVAEINGNRFLSPLQDQNVTAVEGLVLAKGPNGIWIRSTQPDDDDLTSEAVYVFDRNVGSSLAVGDIIQLDGTILEYRSTDTHMFLTEISRPRNVQIISRNSPVVAYVVGEDTLNPPTEQFTGLDNGDVFAVPNDVARLSAVNPVLDPSQYAMDFWEALCGELVTIKSPVGVTRPNQYGDTWVLGTWPATGRNEHGGLTMTDKDGNPEAVVIGTPLDGTRNPETKMGDQFADITGVVTYAFGFYRILPLTAITVETPASSDAEPTTLESRGDCRAITVGSYNVENLWTQSAHLSDIAANIIQYMKTPDLIFVQEVQDNNGPTNDDVASANLTLAALTASIEEQSGILYDFVEVEPVRNQDGGQPGGNIRNAYLYRRDVIELYQPNQGGSTDEAVVVEGPALNFNPGRIDIGNPAWDASRKPLVAAWRAIRGPTNKPFFTVNVHNGSKGGSSPLHGDPRPPVNNGVDKRGEQVESIGTFIESILSQDPKARIIAAGDFNEFDFVRPQVLLREKYNMTHLSTHSLPETERYSYVFDMNSQQLDHIYVSPALVNEQAKIEHIHLAAWLAYPDLVSDHDPLVAVLNVCGC
ncbi:endonuclease/exonuclease/phosphatase family protein [Sodiomyces alkalinus F11]|uniref:Endonuclease/exonuclease/phosphatase family protein n=1 Tax=Sodiomyces alkalinus (strain CBS 110278 / VKM F-3762 / F11) TaxID=1314773 RepID=A0A3N2PQA4_SODAK|nr:endonuclease/exonuclease/phosphatase family protein [Sodiomyces alkalinus F11]ROT36644.1 endonuclease/exonuclease/phosphatase family protein [Sodiomyces alkalinus F11]